jgi:hypothetical protein
MALGVSLDLSLSSFFRAVVCWNCWTYRDDVTLLSRSERCCIVARFIAYIAYCGDPLELRKVTERKCCWPGLETSLESTTGPWNFFPARYNESLILGHPCTTLCPHTSTLADSESRGDLPLVTIGRDLLLRHSIDTSHTTVLYTSTRIQLKHFQLLHALTTWCGRPNLTWNVRPARHGDRLGERRNEYRRNCTVFALGIVNEHR